MPLKKASEPIHTSGGWDGALTFHVGLVRIKVDSWYETDETVAEVAAQLVAAFNYQQMIKEACPPQPKVEDGPREYFGNAD